MTELILTHYKAGIDKQNSETSGHKPFIVENACMVLVAHVHSNAICDLILYFGDTKCAPNWQQIVVKWDDLGIIFFLNMC